MPDFALARPVSATLTTSVTLAAGRHYPANATTAALTLTLPTGTRPGVIISVEKTDASANIVTVSGNMRGAAGQTLQLPWRYDSVVLQSDASGSWWPQVQGHAKAAMDAAYGSGGGITQNTLANAAPGAMFLAPVNGTVTTNAALARPSARTDIFFLWNSTVQPANMLPGDKWDVPS